MRVYISEHSKNFPLFFLQISEQSNRFSFILEKNTRRYLYIHFLGGIFTFCTGWYKTSIISRRLQAQLLKILEIWEGRGVCRQVITSSICGLGVCQISFMQKFWNFVLQILTFFWKLIVGESGLRSNISCLAWRLYAKIGWFRYTIFW